jgi:alkanesulfonate monooxygenase SsuD/methylene tetrahydromethanopterin reductase-like flavin-dependent oxidoreductase (luciferase family)
MRFGYLLSPEYLPRTEMHAALQEQQLIVSACRDLGMSAVLCSEHLSRAHSIWCPPLLLLSKVCEHGEGMTFGTAVLAAGLHNPVALAEQVAFLDAATNGRFVLGLAAGWNRSEFESVGADIHLRGRALDETLEILRALWGSDEPLTYQGQVYRVQDTVLSFRPAAGTGQPVWLGGSSARALARAADQGDTWIVSSHMPTEAAREQAQTYERLLAARGRPVPADRPGVRSVFVAPTVEAARAAGGRTLTASYEMFRKWGLFEDVLDQRLDAVDYQDVTERAIIGNPDHVAEEVVKFARATHTNLLIIRSQWIGVRASAVIDSLELFCTEVAPLVEAELGADAGHELMEQS